MNLDDALQTFIIESRELLENMEDSLLHIEQTGNDPETINAIFRAAHTIKGSAGLFGLDHMVAFTHVAESVLDRVRDGQLSISGDLAALLLEVCDHLGVLVDLIADGNQVGESVTHHGDGLVARLKHYLGQPAEAAQATRAASMPVEHAHPFENEGGGGAVGTDYWHISLRFGPDVLRNGMDPASFIRYLGQMGRIVGIVTLTDGLPEVAEMDPETSYLGFEIAFDSRADKAAIEAVFEFVQDDCKIRILPPHSKAAEYLGLIHDLPEEEMRLGEILIRCGTLTQAELDKVLDMQSSKCAQASRPIGEVLVDEHMVQPAVVEAEAARDKSGHGCEINHA